MICQAITVLLIFNHCKFKVVFFFFLVVDPFPLLCFPMWVQRKEEKKKKCFVKSFIHLYWLWIFRHDIDQCLQLDHFSKHIWSYPCNCSQVKLFLCMIYLIDDWHPFLSSVIGVVLAKNCTGHLKVFFLLYTINMNFFFFFWFFSKPHLANNITDQSCCTLATSFSNEHV